MARLVEPAVSAPVRTFPARPRPVVKATDLGSAQVLKHLDMFLVSDAFGDIHPDSRGMGLYDGDTRILSCSVLRIAGERPVVLHSDPGGSWRGVVTATNPEFRKDPGDKMGGDERILRQTISVGRERTIAEAYREHLDVQNHGPITFACDVEVELDADYADIFEVRGYSRPARGELLPIEASADGGLVFGYVGLDGVTVRTHVAFDPAPVLQPARDEQGGSVVARWTSKLRPGEQRRIAWTVHATRDPVQTVYALDPDALDPAHAHASWLSKSSVIETDHELINQVIRRSLDDLCLLESTDPLGDRFIAAGVPWFTTLFGRDSLITSLQTVSFAPRLAIESLEILAKRQATAVDAWRDAEPGKILHELRTGEMSRTGELPFAPYYGSIDSTPLWLILLGETHDWTGDDALVDRLWPNALAALDWIDQWGDRDGDGFVEYERRAETGLRNQGWKDSIDSIRWLDGSLAETPIALAEVQGYVFDAKRRIARLARRRGEADLAERLENEALELQRRFAEHFRLPDGSIAMALDGAKRTVDTIGSNAGHALWSGIVLAEHAEAAAAALGTGAMVSGWGLRTYAADQPGYNPIGYHTGTVWPHDTAIAAAGLRRYGFDDAADTLSSGMLAAAQRFPAFRLPELFCGFDRASTGSPIAYPVACSPQAWAAGASLMLIRTMLGLQADATNRRLTLDRPILPADLTKVVVRGLRVGDASCDLLLHRWRGLTSAEVLRKDAGLEVVVRL
ncbi:MAG: glycogen debranching N-terminal domain-containing protein [Candidatus Limnocylindrales bacterium]|nr:glycogen debranching N-terminal domain-containing protein [Candidatus Limnocylindrales bacterium]